MKRQLDLRARMAVCDANYLRLLKLMPDFVLGQERTILLPAVQSHSEHGAGVDLMHRLEVRVLEAFRYTSTLSLRLIVEEETPAWFKEPQLTVRLYHDAGTAEVLSYQDQTRFKAFYSEEEAPRFSWDEKNQINLFLADWLRLCLAGGLSRMVLPACLQATSAPPSATRPSLRIL
jgi:uncharacterized protein